MVLITAVLRRVPVIKFRKGGLGQTSGAAASAPTGSRPAAPATAPASAPQASAPMSTSAIADIDLPARYRRTPLSDEEIATINGGGIV